jgi:iron complex outermembrane receptor protein
MSKQSGVWVLTGLALVAVAAQGADQPVLEEIVVTAQKREQSIQEVPVAMTAFDQKMLEDNGAINLADINGIAPNVVLQPEGLVPNTGMFSIRGISYSDPDPTGEPKAGLALDGAFLARNNGILNDLFDIERVEILRGPQGTLFGRNNLAGTINMVSARPTEEFGGKVKVTYGENGQQILRAAINTGSFADGTLRAKLMAIGRSYDGYQKNGFNGHELGDSESYGGRYTLAWDGGQGWDATLIADYAIDHFNGPANSNEAIDPKGTGLDGDVYKVFQDLDGYSDLENWGVTLEANGEFDAGIVTIIANHRDLDYTTFGDFDGRVGTTPPPPVVFHIGRDAQQDQSSFEIRFADSHSELLDYVVGLYYFEEDYDQFNLRSVTLSIRDSAVLSLNSQQSDSWAAFGQTDIHVTDRLALVAGLRYTKDSKDFTLRTALANGTPLKIVADDQSSEVTWKGGFNFDLSEDAMVYANVATGYKAGGFNSRATIQTNVGPYDQEDVISYEVGIKSDWLEKRLRINGAAFYAEYNDVQGALRRPGGNPTGTESITQNLGDVQIKGVEFESVMLFSQHLTGTLNVSYLDAEWDKFMADLTNSGIVTDNSFLDQANAPEWSGYAALDYEIPFAAGAITMHADARYTDKYNTWGRDNAPVYYRDQVTLYNGFIEFMPTEETYRVSVYGKNLTDEEVKSGTVAVLFPLSYYQPPREFGVELQWNF